MNNIRCKCFKSYFHYMIIYWVLNKADKNTITNIKKKTIGFFSNFKKENCNEAERTRCKRKKKTSIWYKPRKKAATKIFNVLYQIKKKSMFLTMILTRIDLSTHKHTQLRNI